MYAFPITEVGSLVAAVVAITITSLAVRDSNIDRQNVLIMQARLEVYREALQKQAAANDALSAHLGTLAQAVADLSVPHKAAKGPAGNEKLLQVARPKPVYNTPEQHYWRQFILHNGGRPKTW